MQTACPHALPAGSRLEEEMLVRLLVGPRTSILEKAADVSAGAAQDARRRVAVAVVTLPFLLGASDHARESTTQPEPPPAAACPAPMILVAGEYCPTVRETCLQWMEPPSLGGDGRCARFAPSACLLGREPLRFCVDPDEYTAPGESLPMNIASWNDARRICLASGKRLCRESEWNFACEGEAILPYPTGLERDHVRCNFDRMDLYDARGRTRDLRLPAAAVAACASPFGVRSMVGNVDEWVDRDVTGGRWRSALKGGWWLAARNRCRPATTAHDEYYRDFQTGFRCCADAAPPPPLNGTAGRSS